MRMSCESSTSPTGRGARSDAGRGSVRGWSASWRGEVQGFMGPSGTQGTPGYPHCQQQEGGSTVLECKRQQSGVRWEEGGAEGKEEGNARSVCSFKKGDEYRTMAGAGFS